MCNLYSMTKNVEAIRQLFGAMNSQVGNLPSLPGIFPDYPAPIVRNATDGLRDRYGALGYADVAGLDLSATADRGAALAQEFLI